MATKAFSEGPQPESCRLISFKSAEVVSVGRRKVLRVQGEAPCLNMQVRLLPRVYVRCPEYWGIEVVGCVPGGICLTALKAYDETLDLDWAIGSKGLEVIGASGSQELDVEGGCSGGEQFT